MKLTENQDSLVSLEILEEEFGQIWFLTFERPEDRNPLDRETVSCLLDIVKEAVSDSKARAFIMTGSGSAFSAGGDLKGYLKLYRDPVAFRQFQDDLYKICELLESGEIISAAMINGTCVAGGLEIALACDMITIDKGARIGDGHLKFGQLPGAGGSQRLCRAIGFQKAREMLLTANLYTAEEAHQMGLVNKVYATDTLRKGTLETVREMAGHSSLAIRRMKELIELSQEFPKSNSLDEEEQVVWTYATTSHDAVEGLNAFAEKRKPEFSGE